MKKALVYLLFSLLLVSIALAVPWSPQDDINLKNRYEIHNGTNATFQNITTDELCLSADTCRSTWPAGGGGGGGNGSRWNITGSTYLANYSGILDVNTSPLNSTIKARLTNVLTGAYWCRWNTTADKLDCDVTPFSAISKWLIQGPYIINASGYLAFNETKQNETIDARDSDTTYDNATPLSLTSTTFGLSPCGNGEIYKYNTSSSLWECEADETGAGGTVTGSGTTDTIPRWASSSSLGDSIMRQISNLLNITGSLEVTENITISNSLCFIGDTCRDDWVVDTNESGRLTTLENQQSADNTTQAAEIDANTAQQSADNTTQANQIAGLVASNSSMDARMDSMESSNTTQANQIAGLVASNTSMDSRMDSMEASNTTQANEIAAKADPGDCAGQLVQNTTTTGVECVALVVDTDTNESVRMGNIVNNECSAGNFIFNHSQDGTPQCDAPAGSGDITAVRTHNIYIYNGSESGDVKLRFNDTKLNETIDAREKVNSSQEMVDAVNGSALNLTNSFDYPETDPQVDTLTATKWCVADATGTAIDCTQDEPTGTGTGNTTTYSWVANVLAKFRDKENITVSNITDDGAQVLIKGKANITGDLYIGEGEKDHQIVFEENPVESLKWDNDTDDFILSDHLQTSGLAAIGGNIFTNNDIYTTGALDDLWLGTSTQVSSDFRAYASGHLVVTNQVNTTEVCLTGDSCRTTWPSGGTGGNVSGIGTSATVVPRFIDWENLSTSGIVSDGSNVNVSGLLRTASGITSQGSILVEPVEATIKTTGGDGDIETEGSAADIRTEGASAHIYTMGAGSKIYTLKGDILVAGATVGAANISLQASGRAVIDQQINTTEICLFGDTCRTTWPVDTTDGNVSNIGNVATNIPYFIDNENMSPSGATSDGENVTFGANVDFDADITAAASIVFDMVAAVGNPIFNLRSTGGAGNAIFQMDGVEIIGSDQVVNAAQVEDIWVNESGDTMTGALTLPTITVNNVTIPIGAGDTVIIDYPGKFLFNSTSDIIAIGDYINETAGNYTRFNMSGGGGFRKWGKEPKYGVMGDAYAFNGVNMDTGATTNAGLFFNQTGFFISIKDVGGDPVLKADIQGAGEGDIEGRGEIRSSGNDFGLTKVTNANTACTSACDYAAVLGQDTGTNTLVDVTDATADICFCAGPS